MQVTLSFRVGDAGGALFVRQIAHLSAGLTTSTGRSRSTGRRCSSGNVLLRLAAVLLSPTLVGPAARSSRSRDPPARSGPRKQSTGSDRVSR